MVDWIAPPHFYKKGQLIVLYAGVNISVIHILEASLGSQFAGSCIVHCLLHSNWFVLRLRSIYKEEDARYTLKVCQLYR